MLVRDLTPTEATSARYDLAFWAAGYEARSCWLVQSEYKPRLVEKWWKVEFEDHREVHSGPASRRVQCGELLGGVPGRQNRDGEWTLLWRDVVERHFAEAGRPLDIFVDYSSMPRAVYGSLMVSCLRTLSAKVRSLTFAYVPGLHGPDVNGSRGVQGLRPLLGTEGESTHDRGAFVLGLGYDGILSQAVLELFQVTHFSCFYGDPGTSEDSLSRVLSANAAVLSRAELVATAPAWSVGESLACMRRLCDWYLGARDVLLIPLGPKPHVLAGILLSTMQPEIGFRFPETSRHRLRPVQVTVAARAVPFFTRIELSREEQGGRGPVPR